MCPTLDSTMKSLPRNFLRVFALVGDSTMTRVLDMGGVSDPWVPGPGGIGVWGGAALGVYIHEQGGRPFRLA